MLGSAQISKKEWYGKGGFSNPRCWRKMVNNGWKYFYRHD